jgi:branched-chain amino acid transport system substrate-binding protein
MIGRRHWLAGVSSVLALGAFALGCDGKTAGEAKKDDAPAAWKVGAYLSLSGEDTAFGVDTKEGIELAIDEVNKAGGVKGKPIKVLYEDDKSTPQEASNKVLQLIDRDKVVAILGEVASSRSRAGGIVANKKKVPMITPSSTHLDVTKVGPFVFRNCFTDDVQGKMGAEFVVKKLAKKKIAIMFASDDLYSAGLAKEFRDEAKRLGGEIAIEKVFLKKETNFTTFISEIKGQSVDVIYAPVYFNQMALIARQAKAEGIAGGMFIGGDGWDADVLLKDAGAELEGAYFTNHYAPDVPWENSKVFVAKYKERFKRDPSSLAAQGYDAAKMLADAIGRAKDGTPDAIRQAIQDTKNFQGATGNITINAERNADKPIVIVQIKDKKFAYHSTVGGGEKGSTPAPEASGSAAAAPAEPSGAPGASAVPAVESAKAPPPNPSK